jgi:transposase InsO family protein
MYSYEDRIRAVKLYIKLGRRVAATIRQLGYPTKRLVRSMSRKGYSPDNAACEGFFGRLKNELFYPRNWRSTTIEQFISMLDTYIRWYNEKRIKISLGALSPVEYRKSLGFIA